MEIIYKSSEIVRFVAKQKKNGNTIGFVPTMGALHEGHLSLLEEAKKKCSRTIVSIFVNPTQFNNPKDLENYPNTIDADIQKLKTAGCSAVFVPTITDIYPKGTENLDSPVNLDYFDSVMEGKFRPGHFKGVAIVVKNLFDIVNPDFAFFGKKDFQQLAVINYLTEKLSLPITIVGCDTKRQSSGLAMSSRNMLLSDVEKKEAVLLYNQLIFAQKYCLDKSPEDLKKEIEINFLASNLILEYFEFCDSKSLKEVKNWSDHKSVTACVAAYLGNVRLIDNLKLF